MDRAKVDFSHHLLAKIPPLKAALISYQCILRILSYKVFADNLFFIKLFHPHVILS